MDRWITYLRERFPLAAVALLVAGISLSSVYLYGKAFLWLSFLLSFAGILCFFALLRLMDDVRDLEKDCIAHRTRPLPRGLIKKEEAIQAIELGLIILFSYSLFIWVCLHSTAALSYICLIGYGWLIYKGFGVGTWLAGRPVWYALVRQAAVLLIAVFAVSAAHPEKTQAPLTWAFAAMLFGAFFCFEICGKLDPHMHPVLATYVHFYGFRKIFELAAFMLIISAMSAIGLGLAGLLLPIEGAVFITLCLLFFQYAWYRIPELAATLSLFIHAWAIVILHFS